MKGKFEQSRADSAPKKAEKPPKAAKESKAEKVAKAPKAPKVKAEKKPPSKKAKTMAIAIPATIFGLVLVGVVGVFAYATTVKSSETIFPGLAVAGVPVGGLTVDEAVDAVNVALAETHGSKDIVITFPKEQLVLSGEELAVTYDVAGAVQLAWNEGRDGSVLDALTRSMNSENEDVGILDYMTFNESYLDETLAQAKADAVSEKTDSSYKIDGDTITVHVGTSSRSLDTDPLKEKIMVALYSNDYNAIPYTYQENPYTPVDMTAIYNELFIDVKDAYYDTETKTVMPEVIGYGFDVEAANQKQMMAEEGSTLSFQMEQVQPEITKEYLDSILFADVLGEDSGPYAANYGRTVNLRLAAEAINGLILNPGEEFSFNNTVGERTAAKGYQSAIVYVSGNSESQLGGGVCQVASHIYMATLLADLKVTERTEHMFSVSYVPMGMDATIYWGALDYRFVNSTEYPIKLETRVENDGNVYVKIWGTQTADKFVKMEYEVLSTQYPQTIVEIDETKPADYSATTQTAYTGYKVQTYKYYVDASGTAVTEKEKVAFSNYLCRDRITVVGGMTEEDPNAPALDTGETGTTAPGTTTPTTPTTPTEPTTPVTPPAPTVDVPALDVG